MARTPVRTTTLVIDDITRIVTLFGTVMNAYRQLGLNESPLTYAQFYRAMNFDTVTPQHKTLIEEAWERWQFLFLRDEVPASSDFTITLENRDVTPEWHPAFSEEDEEEEEDETPRRAGVKSR